MNVEGAHYLGRTRETSKQEIYFLPQIPEEGNFLNAFLHRPVTLVKRVHKGRDCYALIFQDDDEAPVTPDPVVTQPKAHPRKANASK